MQLKSIPALKTYLPVQGSQAAEAYRGRNIWYLQSFVASLQFAALDLSLRCHEMTNKADELI